MVVEEEDLPLMGQRSSTGSSGIQLLLKNVGFNKSVLGTYSVRDSEQRTNATALKNLSVPSGSSGCNQVIKRYAVVLSTLRKIETDG